MEYFLTVRRIVAFIPLQVNSQQHLNVRHVCLVNNVSEVLHQQPKERSAIRSVPLPRSLLCQANKFRSIILSAKRRAGCLHRRVRQHQPKCIVADVSLWTTTQALFMSSSNSTWIHTRHWRPRNCLNRWLEIMVSFHNRISPIMDQHLLQLTMQGTYGSLNKLPSSLVLVPIIKMELPNALFERSFRLLGLWWCMLPSTGLKFRIPVSGLWRYNMLSMSSIECQILTLVCVHSICLIVNVGNSLNSTIFMFLVVLFMYWTRRFPMESRFQSGHLDRIGSYTWGLHQSMLVLSHCYLIRSRESYLHSFMLFLMIGSQPSRSLKMIYLILMVKSGTRCLVIPSFNTLRMMMTMKETILQPILLVKLWTFL